MLRFILTSFGNFLFFNLYPPVLAWMSDIPDTTQEPAGKDSTRSLLRGLFCPPSALSWPPILQLLTFCWPPTSFQPPPVLGLPFTLLGTPTPPDIQLSCSPHCLQTSDYVLASYPFLASWPSTPLSSLTLTTSLQPLFCLPDLPKLPPPFSACHPSPSLPSFFNLPPLFKPPILFGLPPLLSLQSCFQSGTSIFSLFYSLSPLFNLLYLFGL